MDQDTYLTIDNRAAGLFKDKGSRFIAEAIPVTSVEEVKEYVDAIRKEHHVARHHCYAYMIGCDRQQWRVNDDGEPSGTAGKPILGQINSHNLTNILIVVTRYFGGTLLGVSGLINAYRSAAADAISNSLIIEKKLNDYYEIRYPYVVMNDVMRILKEENVVQAAPVFDLECTIRINFRTMQRESVVKKLSRVEGLTSTFLYTK